MAPFYVILMLLLVTSSMMTRQPGVAASDDEYRLLKKENAELRSRLERLETFLQSHGKRSDDVNPLEAVVSQQAEKLTSLGAEIEALKNTHGSTFVRWGRTECPTSTDLVYSGVAAGSWYDDEGGAANRLCMSMQPSFDNATPLNGYHNNLHGAEYYIPGHDHTDVLCAVCRTPLPTTVMVPGTVTCPSGWTNQYTGHITSGHYSYHGASEFLCLDAKPQDRAGSERVADGAYFMYTVTVCGRSLPCPPYQNDKVVTCAVCSK